MVVPDQVKTPCSISMRISSTTLMTELTVPGLRAFDGDCQITEILAAIRRRKGEHIGGVIMTQKFAVQRPQLAVVC